MKITTFGIVSNNRKKEIAEVMNVSLSSVESLIHRAKMNLQKRLSYYYHSNRT